MTLLYFCGYLLFACVNFEMSGWIRAYVHGLLGYISGKIMFEHYSAAVPLGWLLLYLTRWMTEKWKLVAECICDIFDAVCCILFDKSMHKVYWRCRLCWTALSPMTCSMSKLLLHSITGDLEASGLDWPFTARPMLKSLRRASIEPLSSSRRVSSFCEHCTLYFRLLGSVKSSVWNYLTCTGYFSPLVATPL